jgi:prolyl oligopeptidase
VETDMTYRRIAPLALLALSLSAHAQASPPVAPERPVTDDYFGTRVVDPYRWMEDAKSAEATDWMKAQDAHTRSVLERIPGRRALLDRITSLSEAGTLVYQVIQAGSRYFYLKQAPGDDNGKLYVRDDLRGKERLLVDPTKTSRQEPHYSIDYFVPSRDGRYVAYGISPGGSEESILHIIESATGKDLGESIDRALFGLVTWLPDGKTFLYLRLQAPAAKAAPTDKYLKSRIYQHTIGTHKNGDGDAAVFGYDVSPRVPVAPDEVSFITASPASPWALGVVVKFVKNEVSLYAAPLDTVGRADTPWKEIAGEDDDVTKFDLHGDTVYLLTHKNASSYKVVRTSLASPDFDKAETVVPAGKSVLTGLGVAEDALYVQQLDGGIGRVLRVDFSTGGQSSPVPLPYEGSIGEFVVNAEKPGLLMKLTSWTEPQLWYAFDPAANRVTDTGLRPRSPVDYSQIESREVKVASYDGTLVPLSIVMKKGMALDGSHPTLLNGYGAYGITLDPGFNPVLLAWLERGGIFAVAHVRGGGEYGEDWHTAGQKGTKLNTAYDFIACGEYLVDEGYTSSAKLGGQGGSAGGITVGRALTLRPELFAAILDDVGASDTLRFEQTPNGPPNTPEFGTVQIENEFHGLYAMSPYTHVRKGVPYPAVLLTTGVNDPRVAPWEAAKMTARLQAATSSDRPVLLRVDYDAGHGIGSTKSQANAETADQWSFLLWQFGDPGYRPPP